LQSDYDGKSLPNLMLKLKYLLFLDVINNQIHINEIKLPHKIIAKNLGYINWANCSSTTEVTLSLSFKRRAIRRLVHAPRAPHCKHETAHITML
jgi:hypothetical protein